MDERTDEELLSRALDPADEDGARRAASALFRRYQDRVYCWCLRRVRDPELARDVAQEALISAYRRLRSFEGRSKFGSWLFVIARNHCWSALRRPRLMVEDDRAAADVPDPAPDPGRELEERAAEEEALALIRDCLDPFEQEVLWLRCFERLPVDVITEMMGIREASGARGVLQRARRKLRAALAREEKAVEEVAEDD
jgi:RNA polymerase sigma-70 factor (ECF subfamily)